MIHEVRNLPVILDSDLAKLYQTETKRVNEAVKNNPEKFPEKYAFRINEYEFLKLKSKISTSSLKNNYGGSRKGHTVFTEAGIAMLATVLHTKVAIEVTVKIIDAFVNMKHYIKYSDTRISNVETKMIDYGIRIKQLEYLVNNMNKTKNNNLFLEGTIYDAYSLMLDIFDTATKSIIIIDNYIDKSLLDILSKTQKKITIITNKYNNNDYNKYKIQYNNVNLKIRNNIHDRFIFIDDNILYHCGASFKDLGKKCFAITKIEDKEYIKMLLNKYCKKMD